MFDARLALYDLNTMIDLLPLAQEFNVALPLNDDSSLTFTLPSVTEVGVGEDTVGVSDITDVYQYLYNYDIALQVSIDGTWIEPPNCRFYLVGDDVDQSTAEGIKFTGVSAGAFDLAGVVSLNSALYAGADQARVFTNATPGTYLITMLQEAHASGLATAITWDFTTTHDSAGVAWPLAVTMSLKQNATAHDVLNSLTLQGMCDWRFEGNVFRMFAPDGSMHVSKPGVELMLGREVTSGPQRRSVAEMVDTVVVLGDDGKTWLRSRPSSRKRGPRAVVQSQGGVTQDATAFLFADNVLDKGAQIRGELTRDLGMHDECLYFPFFDYGVGDEVMAPGTAGMLEPLRLFQVTISKGGNESLVTGNALFGDRFLEFLTRQSRRISGILGGSTLSGGTNATPVPPPDVDERTPSAPTGLTYDSVAYFDSNGDVFAQFFLQWTPVTTATDSSAMDITSYDVWVRENVPGAPWVILTTTVIPSAAWQPFSVGSSWRFLVRARGKFSPNISDMSSEIVVTMASDATPPGVPSVLTMESSMGVVYATWDGLAASSMAMPVDFHHVEVAIGSSASPVVMTGALSAAGIVSAVATPSTMQYARARAIDRSGNASEWCAISSIVVASILDDPTLAEARASGSLVLAGTIGAGQIAAGAITADKIVAGSITTTQLAAGVGGAINLAGNLAITTLNSSVAAGNTATGNVASDLAVQRTRYNFDATGATISDPLSTASLRLASSRISMLINNTEVSWWKAGVMHVNTFEGANVILGNHQLEKYGTGTVVRRV